MLAYGGILVTTLRVSVRFVINYEGVILKLVVAGKFQHTTWLGRNTKILSLVGIFGTGDKILTQQGRSRHTLGKSTTALCYDWTSTRRHRQYLERAKERLVEVRFDIFQ